MRQCLRHHPTNHLEQSCRLPNGIIPIAGWIPIVHPFTTVQPHRYSPLELISPVDICKKSTTTHDTFEHTKTLLHLPQYHLIPRANRKCWLLQSDLSTDRILLPTLRRHSEGQEGRSCVSWCATRRSIGVGALCTMLRASDSYPPIFYEVELEVSS